MWRKINLHEFSFRELGNAGTKTNRFATNELNKILLLHLTKHLSCAGQYISEVIGQ